LRPARSFTAELVRNLLRKRDFYAGGLIILLGLVIALKGPTYRLGTLMHMGPGFLPTALGVILIFLGILIAGAAFGVPPGEDETFCLRILNGWAGRAYSPARSASYFLAVILG
jgi:hypothetical protein